MSGALTPPAWMAEGLCAQADPEAWFPDLGSFRTHHAIRVCSACPVREACLEFALTERITHGIWGGLGPEARRSLLRKRRSVA